MNLTEIEKRYGFTYPELYKQLEQDGMLDVGEFGGDWQTTVFPKLKENPTLLLHGSDFELLSPAAVHEALQELADPDGYPQMKPEFRLVPFARSGGGDHYCFYLNDPESNEVPIILVWHDSNEAVYLARNMQDYVFTALLTDMSDQDLYYVTTDEEFRNNFLAMMKTHARYLTEKQNRILQEILSREITGYDIELPKGRKEHHRGLLTDQELENILAENVPFEKADTTFEYADE